MATILIRCALLIIVSKMILFDFQVNKDTSQWQIVDDVVMGGKSNGNFKINANGHGEFYGYISLKNNGGFSSVRYGFSSIDSKNYNRFLLHIKGDGNPYQFRVKDNKNNRFSYVYTFQTSGDWETIEIPFNTMEASFRGYKLDLPNFNGDQMAEIAFLIANKKEQHFKIQIDKISIL